MNYPKFFDSRNSMQLFELKKDFAFLSKLYINKKLPKVLMLSGNKGLGKSTLVNHFLYSIFDPKNYDLNNNIILSTSVLHRKIIQNIFSNIIYLKGSDYKSVKIDDIRNLKDLIFKSSLLDKDRFIILDDVELFNINSLNALLKIIEEPNKINFFILINNKSKPLLETINSRALEIKITLKEEERIKIIKNLIEYNNLEIIFDPINSHLTPGNFVLFNYICKEKDIAFERDFIENFSLLLNLYKKDKNSVFINIIFFLVDFYIRDLKLKKKFKNDKFFEKKNFIFDNLNNFLLYNTNQKSLIDIVNNKLKNE